MSFNSRRSCRSCPGLPLVAKRGVWRVGVAKALLPSPPRPPRQTHTCIPGWFISLSSRPYSVSKISVPSGTGMTRSSPSAPWRLAPSPQLPLRATQSCLPEKSVSVSSDSSTTKMISPPRPPSPPSGPPLAMNFSRRKLTQPCPPSPALTRIFASSINMLSNHIIKYPFPSLYANRRLYQFNGENPPD